MHIHMRDFLGKQRVARYEQQIDAASLVRHNASVRSASAFAAAADVAGEPEAVAIAGRMQGEVTLVCSRCLEAFAHPMSFSFVERLANGNPDEDEPASEEQTVHVVTEDRVELLPLFEENFQLKLPMFPLCDEHCKGLCPSCGINRNSADCGCETERIDPRWGDLKHLFKP